MSEPKKYHDEWCDLRHGGIECNCTYFDQPTVAHETVRGSKSDEGAAEVRE